MKEKETVFLANLHDIHLDNINTT